MTTTSGEAPLEVVFTVNADDSTSESGVYYTIVFGDEHAGGFSHTTNPSTTHTYELAGEYKAVVTRRTQCSSWECLGESKEIATIDITVQ